MDRSPHGGQIAPYACGHFTVSRQGVYFHSKDGNGNAASPQWISSELRIVAYTRDGRNTEWGRLLEWEDNDGHAHQWAMPMELLEGDGSEVRRILASRGVSIAPSLSARNHLAAYIKVWPVSEQARCVDSIGWHGKTYVTTDGAMGGAEERIVFQNPHAHESAIAQAGTSAQWRDTVARFAQGNSRLVFAISCAFAGPLAKMVGEDSGGFHLRGGSSSGKSTALKVAASVCGLPARYVRNWRATINGLEGLAILHNDGTLILDEIGQADPNALGDAAYLLANGQGKARAGRSGQAKPAQRWRLLFLSAGEESLAGMMERAGRKASAGQEIRLAEIEADAGAGMGLFERLHGYASAAQLAAGLSTASATAYGTVGREWLEHLVAEHDALLLELAQRQKEIAAELLTKTNQGQLTRVARRFALVALAGELATERGLTGWPTGEATMATKACFVSWLTGFGDNGSREAQKIISQAQSFLEKHGGSRFEYLQASTDERVQNRAGFYCTLDDGQREFLMLPESFREHICQGYPVKTVTAVLSQAGMLVKGNADATQVVRIPELGGKGVRVYVLRHAAIEEEERLSGSTVIELAA
jgi:uncharacterized protein (DUF927 family)